MTFSTILFDLFDTLVRFDRNRLPEVQIDGKGVRSTAGHLFPVLAPHAPGVDLPRFFEALIWSWQEAERLRAADYREVGAPERFALLFSRLGLDPGRIPADVLDALLSTHKRHLSQAAELPPEHLALIIRLAPRYRLGIVSNFDYAPTAHWILERERAAGLFQAVVVSADVGWRKPKPAIFEAAFQRLGIGPADALFVGDRADIDVVGAKAVGMAVAWLNPGGEAVPPGLPEPEYELKSLVELERILAPGEPGPDPSASPAYLIQ
ncbi:MAG: HAD family hydrolase [Candidatus Rokubacteria bacterium]|nr:HAD family hydrolase [Candidatus Rokubacteria bacterium]